MRFTPKPATAHDFFTAITDSITREAITGIGEFHARRELRKQLAALVAEAQVNEPDTKEYASPRTWDLMTIEQQAAYARRAGGYSEAAYQFYLVSQKSNNHEQGTV